MPSISGRDPLTGRSLEVAIEGEFVSNTRDVSHEPECWIAPGLVDLQVNGYLGLDLNSDDISPELVLALTRALAKVGTTTYLPTIITASRDAMLARLHAVATARERYEEVRHAVPGIHLEGPYLSELDGFRGAHPVSEIRPPSFDEFEAMQAAAGGSIRLVTLSPHWPNTEHFIRWLTQHHVQVSIGHTHATPDQIRTAVDAGATLSTHLGNGIAVQLPRHPNPIWTQLADDRLTAGFIADGAHLSADTLRVMLRAKGVAHSMLVSDSVALAGSPPGLYKSFIGGDVVVHPDGSIRMNGSDLLAGSGIALKDAVGRTPIMTGCTLGDAVRMATKNPAALLALPSGEIKPGAYADLIRFRWDESNGQVEIVDVFVRGQAVQL